jgi:hypothetical protein
MPTELTTLLGFDPNIVRLQGETISSPFRAPRPRKKCPHRGIDITSSQTNKPYCAGIFGRVTEKLGGELGTITVVFFVFAGFVVQYLHNSRIDVSVGSVVAPWTQIGVTGDTAPPGDSQGIHLHVHVVQASGLPGELCWDRNYVDPATWQIADALIGNWTFSTSPAPNLRVNRTLRVGSSSIGSEITLEGNDDYTTRSGCRTNILSTWKGQIASEQGVTAVCPIQQTRLEMTPQCPLRLDRVDGTLALTLQAENVLIGQIVGGPTMMFSRVAAALKPEEVVYLATDKEELELVSVSPDGAFEGVSK